MLQENHCLRDKKKLTGGRNIKSEVRWKEIVRQSFGGGKVIHDGIRGDSILRSDFYRASKNFNRNKVLSIDDVTSERYFCLREELNRLCTL